MDESIRELSEWWLPGEEAHPAVGELRFDPSDGLSLTLFGLPAGLKVAGVQPPITLLGRTFDGTALTLSGAIVMRRQITIGEGTRSRIEFHASALLRGSHREEGPAVLVKRARVRFAGLRELCFRPAMVDDKLVSFLPERPGTQRRLNVDHGYLTFESIEARGESKFGGSWERDVFVLVEADQAVPLEQFEHDWLAPIQGLVMLASREPTVQQELTLLLPDPLLETYHPAITHGTPPELWSEEPVALLTATPGLTAEPASDYDHLLVPFAVLADGITDFVANWFRLYAELGDAALTLMSALGSRLFLENKLLNEMSFAESYHRIKHDEPSIPADDHDRYVAEILAVVPVKSHRKHYEQRLKYAAEQTARQRLKWLVGRASDALPLVGGLGKQLANDLVDTRNAITHLDPAVPAPLRDADLFCGVARLELVLQANILLDLHLDPALVTALLMNSYRNQVPMVTFNDG